MNFNSPSLHPSIQRKIQQVTVEIKLSFYELSGFFYHLNRN